MGGCAFGAPMDHSSRSWRPTYDPPGGGGGWGGDPHQARSRAYRWGEDGLAGISDDKQRLCFALAPLERRDPILKERLFGLTNAEGNHGEDVKEYYFYVDNLADPLVQRWLYKYPQAAYPYDDLVRTNRRLDATSSSTSCSTPACSTTTATSTSRSSTPRPARRHPVLHHRPQPRTSSRRAAPAADALVPQHVVVAARHGPAGDLAVDRSRGRVAPIEHPSSGDRSTSTPRPATEPCCSARTSPTRAAWGRRRIDAVPQGRHQRPRRARHRPRSTRRARAPRRGPLPADRAPGGGRARCG